MDFIEGLPKSDGKDSIMVIVDRYSKYGHFVALTHPYTVREVAKAFFNTVYKLHGLPEKIISDRDKVFTSGVWKELFKMLGTKLQMSSAYHPQSDGQTERLNRCLETFLRCMCSQHPQRWCRWLAHAEWWYNTNFHSALGTTPYKALYGREPPVYMTANLGLSSIEEVQDWGRERERIHKDLRENLLKAQNRMKQFADRHRREKEFKVGDAVFLKLQPYRQKTVAERRNLKLSSRYFGPFKILEKIGPMAYRLQLPEGSRIHSVFHVSLLKGGPPEGQPASPSMPPSEEEEHPEVMPERILDRRMIKRGSKAVSQVLVGWSNLPDAQATWEDYWSLKMQFPNFDP